MTDKERLDVLIVNRGLASSRELAKAYIMAGNVYVDGVYPSHSITYFPAGLEDIIGG